LSSNGTLSSHPERLEIKLLGRRKLSMQSRQLRVDLQRYILARPELIQQIDVGNDGVSLRIASI